MHSENIKVLAHPIVGNVQEKRHRHIGTVLNDLQRIDNVTSAKPQIDSSQLPGFSSFYVSFRLASVLPMAHSWGVYISQADISMIEQNLITHGFNHSDAQKFAEESLYSSVAFQYLLDCQLLNLHEVFYIAGMGFQTQRIYEALLVESSEAGHFGFSFVAEKYCNQFGHSSTQASVIKHFLPPLPPRQYYSSFSRDVFGQVLWNKSPIPSSGSYARERFLKTIPVYTNPKRAFPGISLPVNRF